MTRQPGESSMSTGPSSSTQWLRLVGGLVEFGGLFRVGAAHFGARLLGREHPFHAGAGGVALALPGGDLALKLLGIIDAPVQALALAPPDFDLDHVEPPRVLGGVVELEPLQDAMRFRG